METIDYKNLIKESIKSEDPNLLKRLVEVIENYKNDKQGSVLSDKQVQELEKRRNRYLTGDGKSYSWQEVRQELIEKHGLPS